MAAQLLAVEAGVDHHSPSARVHFTGGVWLTLRAARIGDARPGRRTRHRRQHRGHLGHGAYGPFALACGLSAREAELLGHLVEGSDTRRVAHRMFLSEHTVQDHLKSIFAKTGACNRRTLLARATGR